MEFEERLSALSVKVAAQGDAIVTEEATKNAFVMPFIASILGYDVFNPLEVVPEFTADVGVKKGEKVDYAVMRDGEVQMLIECKKSAEPLAIQHASQLFRYFSVTNARIAALTNGQIWNFYTDLDAPNKMDEKPFLILDLLDIDDSILPELQKLTKESFDLDSIISAAEELKYVGSLKREIAVQLQAPTDDFVRFLTTRVYDKSFTAKVRDQFTGLVTKAVQQYLNEKVNDRLKSALGGQVRSVEPAPAAAVQSEAAVEENLTGDQIIETTEEELEAYHIVKAIAASELKPTRINYRDQQSYCAIIVDNNNRKPIARLWFNGKAKKYIGLFDDKKIETKFLLGSVADIYSHAEQIRSTARLHVPPVE